MWGMNLKNTLSVLGKGVDLEVYDYYDYVNVNLAKYEMLWMLTMYFLVLSLVHYGGALMQNNFKINR